MTLKGKTALITGAAQGIGKATAILMAQKGARVALVDRVLPACESLCAELKESGADAVAIEADLETKSGVDSMIEQALAFSDVIDIAVNNVGGTMWTKPFWEYEDDEIQQEITRSLWPTLRSCRAIIPIMIKQNRGSIVNIGSVATRGIYRVPYSAAKGGVSAMTVCMAMELAEYNVRVNCVSPGAIKADRVIPRRTTAENDQEKVWHKAVIDQTIRDSFIQRLGEADEVARAISFLASDDASYITGETIHVAGGGIG